MIEQVLRSYVVDGDGHTLSGWHETLGHCEFALNSAVSASTGLSPFEMVYGSAVAVPVDCMGGTHRVAQA